MNVCRKALARISFVLDPERRSALAIGSVPLTEYTIRSLLGDHTIARRTAISHRVSEQSRISKVERCSHKRNLATVCFNQQNSLILEGPLIHDDEVLERNICAVASKLLEQKSAFLGGLAFEWRCRVARDVFANLGLLIVFPVQTVDEYETVHHGIAVVLCLL